MGLVLTYLTEALLTPWVISLNSESSSETGPTGVGVKMSSAAAIGIWDGKAGRRS